MKILRLYKVFIVFVLLLISGLSVFLLLDDSSAQHNNNEYVRRENVYATVFLSESGTEDNPYVIGGKDDMVQLSQLVSSGQRFKGKVFVVASNLSEINLGDFQPIGTSAHPFEGTFDGNGVNFILNTNKPDQDYVGLFGVTSTGVIENLSVSGLIVGRNQVGSIVGHVVSGTVRNVYSKALVTGSTNVGGITGYMTGGTVTNSYFIGNVEGYQYVAGIVGRADSYTSITNSYNAGLVSADVNVVNGVVNNYSTYSTTRTNLYYDVSVIAKNIPTRTYKPSTLTNAQALDAGKMLTDMSNRLNSAFTYRDIGTNYGYYPELKYFKESNNSSVRSRSLESVTIDISNGIGTSDKPFLIRTVQDLENLKTVILKGETFEGFYFKVADGRTQFNLGNFVPIGTSSRPFYGSFDGNNVEFVLNIENETLDNVGLFGYYGKGVIKNLSVKGYIVGRNNIGGVIGYLLSGTVQNVYNEASIDGNNNIGGIVGYMKAGTAEVSYNNGPITAAGDYAGGIVGYQETGTVRNVYNASEILANRYAAGIVGGANSYTSITNTYSRGLVSSNVSAAGISNNLNGYSTTRSYNYYDISVLAMYDQKRALKPSVASSSEGRTSNFLIDAVLSNLGYSNTIWYVNESAGNIGYYPELIVFKDNKNSDFSVDSKNSITRNISKGFGTLAQPFLIETVEEMNNLSYMVSRGNSYASYYFKVKDGITELNLGDFQPIGNPTYPFDGNFNGNGVNFKLSINKESLDNIGLFGASRTGTIENLSVSGSIIGRNQAGSIVGQQYSGTIKNVYSTAYVVASGTYGGGIVGYMNSSSTLTLSYFRGEVLANSYAAGLVGGATSSNTISYSYSSGEVSSNAGVDGIVNNLSTYGISRTAIFYDITVIANYVNPNKNKPSALASTQGLNSGEFFSNMSSRLGNSFEFVETEDGFAYYPQLKAFSEHKNETIKNRSKTSVQVNVSLGLGTELFPFILESIEDIENLKDMIKKGNNFQGFYFKMADGIEKLKLGNFEPIGSQTYPFYGSFDGNFVEFELEIDHPDLDNQGLFGYFGVGTIKNLYVSGSVKGKNNVGSVVGYQISGKVMNVYNLADIEGVNQVGGIVGQVGAATVEVAYNQGNITASTNYAGGIVGYLGSNSVVRNTYNRGEILSNSYAAGLVGGANSSTSVTYSYSAGFVSSNSYVDGVVNNLSTYGITRSYIYYDTSILVNYPQPKNLKPQVTGNSNGRTSNQLLYGGTSGLKLSEEIWHFDEKDDTYGFYPQLSIFRNHESAVIRKDSIDSVKVDITDGFGTSDAPFLIRTKEDMDNLSEMVRKGNTYINYYFKVDDGITEIDLGDFIPIGTTTYPFEGTFNGNGANFKLSIDKGTLDNIGLFGVTRTGIVENLSVSGSIKGRNRVGSVVGQQLSGIVRNVYSTANVIATASYAGGIIGYMNSGSTLTLSYNRGEVLANSYAAGLVGGAASSNTISYAYSSGEVSSNTTYVDGIVNNLNTYGIIRSAIFYDITVIANYENIYPYKPSALASSTGLNSGEFFKNMSSRLGTNFIYLDSGDEYAYYPQLKVFANHEKDDVISRSKKSVQIDVSLGLGTEQFPFLIKTIEDLDDIRSMVNRGNTFQGFYFKMDDSVTQIELGDFEPIGTQSRPFYGSFDGNFVEFILEINRPDIDNIGLFGYFGIGTIKNLYVTGSITGKNNVGSVVGYQISGNVFNVYNHANINGVNQIGGIVGQVGAAVIQVAYNFGDITATGDNAGGIAGYLGSSSSVLNIYNRGEILANRYAAGLVGGANSSTNISNGYSAGLVSSNTYVDGVVNNLSTYGTTRSRIYYDTSLLVNYDQPKASKPPTTGNANGRTSNQLLYSGEALGLPSNVWYFEPKDGDFAYYPQLLVFANHINESIRKDSKRSVEVDVSKGLGTEDFPFLITSKADMDELSRMVRDGNTYVGFYFKVADEISEIDLEDFIPIGTTTYPFDGHFNGNGVNFILDINRTDDNVGLFGVSRTGTIENLSVSGSITGRNQVGSVVGQQLSGTVRNVYSTAKVHATGTYAGGIIGYMNSGTTLTQSYFRGEVTAQTYAAGLVGGANSSNKITHSYSAAKVASNTTYVHGLVNNTSTYGITRTNLYYDITEIANYDTTFAYKPSAIATNEGLNSGIFFTEMANRLGGNFEYVVKNDEFAYYPQLKVFFNHEDEKIKENSTKSVIVDIKGGLGTEQFPFILKTREDIENLKRMIEKGNTFQGFYFIMDESVEKMTLDDFTPIGTQTRPFYGSFDGNFVEFEISIHNSTLDNQGLFGYFGVGIIKNLKVSGIVQGRNNVAGVVGYQLSGTVMNVYNFAKIEGTKQVAGIVGQLANGMVQNAYNTGLVTGNGDYAGGIVGYQGNGTVQNTYNRGEIISNRYVAGIVGGANSYTKIVNSYSSALVSGASYVNGVVNNLSTYSTTRTNLYYDVSILERYVPPKGAKPSTTVGGQGLAKTSMFSDGLKNRGFSESTWVFLEIDGQYAYYPQLRVFAQHEIEFIKNDSMMSVRTNPFLGDGTKASPYIISTAYDMMNLANSINKDYQALDTYYMVAANVAEFDLSKVQFKPIGSKNYPFLGHFDGNYANFHVNLNLNEDYVGLFGAIGEGASVKNLSVTGSIKGNSYTGSIVGYNQGLVEQVYSTATVQGDSYVGGLVGRNIDTLKLAYYHGVLSATGQYVGGIAGYNSASIHDVYTSAKVSGMNYVGAILGYNIGNIEDAYFNYTEIEYFSPENGIKPNYAVSNELNKDTVRGLAKEIMFTLDAYTFDASEWETKATSGMYNYYLQLKGFSSNLSSVVKNNSIISVRTVRFAVGSGDQNYPYLIRHEEDMRILSLVSQEDSLEGLYFKVMDGVKTLDLSNPELGFLPIGPSFKHFKGHFDGNGVNIILQMNRSTSDYIGLFGYIENSTIKNLHIEGQIDGRDYVGVIGAAVKSQINEVFVNTVVNGRSYVGGITGYSDQTQISNSYNLNQIKGSNQYIGGLVGYSTKTQIKNVFNYGSVYGRRVVGGIVGDAETNTNIEFAYNRKDVYAEADYAGGITAYLNNGYVGNVYSASPVRAQSYVGGLIGRMAGQSSAEKAYYDMTIIEADTRTQLQKPSRAISNAVDTDTVRGVLKSELIGLSYLEFDSGFTYRENDGILVYYPELKVFKEHRYTKVTEDSFISVSNYVFEGLGTKDIPYIIVNEKDMVILSELVNKGMTFENTYFKVRENATYFNMTYSSLNYKGIGSSEYPFEGYFDGSGITFELNMNLDQNYVGLFNYVGLHAEIKNLSIKGTIKGKDYVGSVVGYNLGTISNVYSTANVLGHNHVGGITGYQAGSLTKSYMIGSITGESFVGGISGSNLGEIYDVYVVSKVFGLNNLGAIVGYDHGSLDYGYYNYEIIEIYNLDGFNKPTTAVGNTLDHETLKGLTSYQMTLGTFGEMEFKSSDRFEVKAPNGFEVYYPQLKVFSQHKLDEIKRYSLLSVTALRFKEGDGSKDNPFIIRSHEDMKAVSDLIIARNTLAGLYFKVADEVEVIDLTLLESMYVPIGNQSYKFMGNFDGTYTKFIIDIERNQYYQGLFGYIGSLGVVKNLSTEGKVAGQRFTGGIAGRNEGKIENAYNLANIIAYEYYAGGIAGYNEGIIQNTFNTGMIKVNSYDYAGGIVGAMNNTAKIYNSYNTGSIQARYYIGGIAGLVAGEVKYVYHVGKVKGSGYIGAIAGLIEGKGVIQYGYYDLSLVKADTNNQGRKAVSNINDSNELKGLSTYQLSGPYKKDLGLLMDTYDFKNYHGYDAYYPELIVFKDAPSSIFQEDSLSSIKGKIYQGEGTKENPYYIIVSEDFNYLYYLTNEDLTLDTYFKVFEKSQFDLTSEDLIFKPIGSPTHPFKGHFDGNNSEFKVNINQQKDYQGLFGYVDVTATIKNLSVTGSIKGLNYVGGIAGYSEGLIMHVSNFAKLEGNEYVGGLVGYMNGQLENAYNSGTIIAHNSYVGGLVGYAKNSMIEFAYNRALIESSALYTAGLVGYLDQNSEIKFSFNYGNITSSEKYVAGLVAYNEGYIENSYNTGDLSTTKGFIAGIVAVNYGHIQSTYHSGLIIGPSESYGVSYYNEGIIENSYFDLDHVTNRYIKVEHIIVTQALKNEVKEDVKGLRFTNMTGLNALGNNDEQMNLDITLYIQRENFDFTSHYPELRYFNQLNDIRKEHSYESILSQKLEGIGTKEKPFIIYDGFDMMEIHSFVVNGVDFKGKYFKIADSVQTIDLTVEGLDYEPIGDTQNNFNGNFDGNKKRIYIQLSDEKGEYLGVFHTLGMYAYVHDLTIMGKIEGLGYFGALAGRNFGILERIENLASMESNAYEDQGGNSIGGITGVNQGTIKQSVNKGSIKADGSFVGGIAGENIGTIQDTYNHAYIVASHIVGGIAGTNRGDIIQTYNKGEVKALVSSAGGIVGENLSYVKEAFNYGTITSMNDIAGGISGLQVEQNAIIESVYNTGLITAMETIAGGLVGKLDRGKLFDGYSASQVYAKGNVGMLVGQSLWGSIDRAYYDKSLLSQMTKQNTLSIPTKAVGDHDFVDNDYVKGLYHGHMVGLNALGNLPTQLNLHTQSRFTTQSSFEKYAYYPQLTFFKSHTNEEVRKDSLDSVKTKTFMIGEGSKENPYIIFDESDMVLLSETVNSGNTYEGIYLTVSDETFQFDLRDQNQWNFKPIGNGIYGFNGIFDGRGATFILNIQQTLDYAGLFGYTLSQASIKNLSVDGLVSGNHYVGSVVGYSLGSISNVYNTATIKGKDSTGGIVGYLASTLDNAFNMGEITGSKNTGGIVGLTEAIVQYTYNAGVVYGLENVGAIAGFLNETEVKNSYYDSRLLSSYRGVGNYQKPTKAVGNSQNSSTVYGLDYNYMTGIERLGLGSLQMNFSKQNWTDNINIDDNENYPQLSIFSKSNHEEIRLRSKEATRRTYYQIYYDYNSADGNNDKLFSYVIPGYHYELVVPYKFGFILEGWYYTDNDTYIKYTDGLGMSLEPFNDEENITLVANYEVKYHMIQFIDGNNKVIDEINILHGDFVTPSTKIPTKNPSSLKIYQFEAWDFDFSQQIFDDTKIYGRYLEIDRFYTVTFLDGDDNFFKEVKVEYGNTLEKPSFIPRKSYDEYAYEFVDWDFNFDEFITENTVVKPIFKKVPRYYEVTFLNGDGSILYVDIVEYLSHANPPTEGIKKEPTKAYVYEFIGWDKPIDEITQNIIVNPLFEEKDRYYEVTFMDGNDKVFKVVEVVYLGSIEENIGEPRKDPKGEYAYQFIGWNHSLQHIEDNIIVYPEFKEIPRYYEVVYLDGNGDVFEIFDRVEYLNDAPLPNSNPTKDGTEMYVYEFESWSDNYKEIRENTVVTPRFKESLRPFTVTFLDGNGNIHEVQTVLYGMNASPPRTPKKDAKDEVAYRFVRWDHDLQHITADITIKPIFEEVQRYYNVIFYGYDLDLILKTERVEYLGSATPPVAPIPKHANEAYEYVFIKWDKPFDEVTSDLVVYAVYESRIKQYEITFVDGDSTYTLLADHGSTLELPVGTKESTDQIKYEFLFWTLNDEKITELKNIKQNYTLYAVFDEIYLYYIVRFIDGDNNIMSIEHVFLGEAANAPFETPTKKKTDTKVYVFTGWDKDFSEVYENLDIYALFEEKNRFYDVKFYDAYGSVISKQVVEYGMDAIVPEIPIKASDEVYHYEFVGWTHSHLQVKENLDIHPVFESVLRKYQIIFMDAFNNEFLVLYANYGESITPPKNITKEPKDNTYYVFNRWSEDLSFISKDLIVYPIFDEVDRYYEVTYVYLDLNNQEKSIVEIVEYGQDAKDILKELPIIVLSDEYVYAPIGWSDSLKEIKENKTVYAEYETRLRYFDVRLYNDLELIETIKAQYGSNILPSYEPTKLPTQDHRFEFVGWSEDLTYVTHEMDVYAVYKTYNNVNIVTFMDGDGNIFYELEVKFGEDVYFDGIPSKTPTEAITYKFIGWDHSLKNIKEDTVVYPLFEEVTRKYVVVFVDELGNIISEQFVAYGSSATEPTQIKLPKDTEEFTYTYRWSREFNHIIEDTLVQLIIEANIKRYTYTFFDSFGNIYYQVTDDYGSTVIPPKGPIRENTPQYTYVFIGWDKEIPEMMTKDLSFYPVYDEIINKYLVTYLDGDDEIFYQEWVDYGDNGSIPLDKPTKTPNQQYYYVFRIWDRKPIYITQDTTIKPIFDRYLQVYEVQFIDEEGNVINKQNVEYGMGAIEPAIELIPTKPPTFEYEYIFVGWDKPFNFITEDTIVQARYAPVVRMYTYTFYDSDHVTILKQVKGAYGTPIIAPTPPDRELTDHSYERFVGWDKTVAATLTENVEYYAIYEEVLKTYVVKFFDGNGLVLDIQIIEYGKPAKSPAKTPTKEMTEKYEYFFQDWDQDFSSVKNDLNIYPVFKAELRRFIISFVYEDEIIEILKPYGSSIDFDIDPIPTPLKAGHSFVRWDQDLTNITKDIETYPIFKANRYKVFYYVLDADSGSMTNDVVTYGNEYQLRENEYYKLGYEFIGWRLDPDSNEPVYNPNMNIIFDFDGNLELYATFKPINYDVIYDTDGGSSLSKDTYSIETGLSILPTPEKEYNLFLGWILEDIILSEDEQKYISITIDPDGNEFITEIPVGFIGHVKLKARYLYNGFIELKDEYKDKYLIAYADVTSIIPITKREKSENDVYLFGSYLNQTLADLKEKFINENLEFVDESGNTIDNLDSIVRTGIRIVIRDQKDPSVFIDQVIIVLKGDVNGDGFIDINDYNAILLHIRLLLPIEKELLLAAMIDEDKYIDVVDLNLLLLHIRNLMNIFE